MCSPYLKTQEWMEGFGQNGQYHFVSLVDVTPETPYLADVLIILGFLFVC